jgi:NADH dehydrogenase FAD-containing subunit
MGWPPSPQVPYRRLLRKGGGGEVIQGDVSDIDPATKTVTLKDGRAIK